MTEKAKETVRLSAGTLLQLGSILTITILSFALVKSQSDENKRNIQKHDVKFEKNDQDHALFSARQQETDLLVREYKGDIKTLLSSINELKYEVRENRSEMKRWELSRGDE